MLRLVVVNLVVDEEVGGHILLVLLVRTYLWVLHVHLHVFVLRWVKNLSLAAGRLANMPKNLGLRSDPVLNARHRLYLLSQVS